jgi:SAM-dependent methyltransferase
MGDQDVPSPIDFHDAAQARAWEEATVAGRPSRPAFFAAMVAALNARFDGPFSVLELGSGPGHLAEQILRHCSARTYVALDFSEAMHALARERLTSFKDRVRFVMRDFRDPKWGKGLGMFDAILTQQAAHETRHKKYLVRFLHSAAAQLREDGLLLYCDHYAEAGTDKHPDLYVARDAQPVALLNAGLSQLELLHDEGGMALYSAAKT